jgi:hypothetical protein
MSMNMHHSYQSRQRGRSHSIQSRAFTSWSLHRLTPTRMALTSGELQDIRHPGAGRDPDRSMVAVFLDSGLRRNDGGSGLSKRHSTPTPPDK